MLKTDFRSVLERQPLHSWHDFSQQSCPLGLVCYQLKETTHYWSLRPCGAVNVLDQILLGKLGEFTDTWSSPKPKQGTTQCRNAGIIYSDQTISLNYSIGFFSKRSWGVDLHLCSHVFQAWWQFRNEQKVVFLLSNAERRCQGFILKALMRKRKHLNKYISKAGSIIKKSNWSGHL